jgi:hypothetical protein
MSSASDKFFDSVSFFERRNIKKYVRRIRLIVILLMHDALIHLHLMAVNNHFLYLIL